MRPYFFWQLGWMKILAPQISMSTLVGVTTIGVAPLAFLYACKQTKSPYFAWDINEYWEACGRGEN